VATDVFSSVVLDQVLDLPKRYAHVEDRDDTRTIRAHIAVTSSTPSLLSDMGGQQRAVGRHVFPKGLTTYGVTDLASLAVQAGAGDLQHLHGARIANCG
jgi:hypothetical protein